MDVNEKNFIDAYLIPGKAHGYDPNKPTAYLIEGSSGTYDLSTTFSVVVKKTLESAQKFIIEHEEWRNKTEELAIKNDLDYGKYAYNLLYDEYMDYVYNKICPGKTTFDLLTDEEGIAVSDYESDENNFFKWMTEVKGYSKEVAQATLDYNSGELSEYNTSYSIYKINIED